MIRYVLVLALFAPPLLAGASPTASFTMRAIQGSGAVAPCTVHFDAIGSSNNVDSQYGRDFHSLQYVWDFGDPDGGVWEHSGLDKNTALGGIAGHTFTRPGVYTVTLKVSNPAGESDQSSRTFTCRDPLTTIGRSSTYCFANDSQNWSGCPLDCSGADAARCVTTSSWATALATARTSTGARQVLFRRGDTFGGSGGTLLPLPDGQAGLISSFGSGARPVMTSAGFPHGWTGGGSGGSFQRTSGDRWTIASLVMRSSGGINTQNSEGISLYDLDVTCATGSCWGHQLGGGDPVWALPDRVGIVEVDFTYAGPADGPNNYVFWPGGRYVVWQGGTIDAGGGLIDVSVRAWQLQWSMIQHTKWTNPGSAHFSFRCQDDLTGASSVEELAAHHFVLADNIIDHNPARGSFIFPMFIVEDGSQSCHEGAGGACNNRCARYDTIVERNFFRLRSNGSTFLGGLMHVAGGDWTVRNNIVDLQDGSNFVGSPFRFIQFAGNVAGARGHDSPSTGMHVYGNTVYFDDSFRGGAGWGWVVRHGGESSSTGCTDDCVVAGNLLYAPGWDGQTSRNPQFSYVNNVELSSGRSPFMTDPIPAQPGSSAADFQLDPGSDGDRARDQGVPFGSQITSWVHEDFFRGCRGDAASWDAGAHESGAGTSCYEGISSPPPSSPPPSSPPPSSSPPPPEPPAAPVLLP